MFITDENLNVIDRDKPLLHVFTEALVWPHHLEMGQ